MALGLQLGNVEMGLLVSQQVLPKIFAELAYHKGYMIDDRYNAEGHNSLDIMIPMFNRPKGKFKNIREVTYNPFENSKDQVTQTFGTLTVDMEYNEQIEVPEAQIAQNIVGDKVIGTMTNMVSSVVAEQLNFLTAEAIYKSVIEYNTNKADKKIVYFNSGNDSLPDKVAELQAYIGNADPSKGDTSFNSKQLSQVISNTAYAQFMKTKNQFILESSLGQEILIDGGLGKVTLGDINAYRGKVLGVHTFVLPDIFFPSAGNANFENSVAPTAGKVLAIMGIPESTFRVFIDRGIKVIDAVDFRGWNLQPMYRVGVGCLKPWGNGLIVSNDFAHANLTEQEIEFTIKGTGSVALEGALVTIGDETKATDASGKVTFNRIAGKYDYAVNADEYVESTGDVTVTTAKVTKTVTLVADE